MGELKHVRAQKLNAARESWTAIDDQRQQSNFFVRIVALEFVSARYKATSGQCQIKSRTWQAIMHAEPETGAAA